MGLVGFDASGHATTGYAVGLGKLGGTLGDNGLLLRLGTDALTYDYRASAGLKEKAKSWGVDGSLGYQYFLGSGLYSAYVGIADRYTALSPFDPRSDQQGNRIGARVELDGNQPLTPELALNGIATYVSGVNEFWTRGQLNYSAPFIPAGWTIGPEVLWQGNDNYRAVRGGASLGNITLFGILKASVDAGYEKNDHFAGTAYGGANVALFF